MRGGSWLRSTRTLAVVATLAALAAGLVVAAPGGAAVPETESSSGFEAACVLGPGVFNQKGNVKFAVNVRAPIQVVTDESVTFTEAGVTITVPSEWAESFAAIGATEVRERITRFQLTATNMEPPTIDIAPPEGASSVSFTEKVTGSPGKTITLGVAPEPGYEEIAPTRFEATGHGIVFTLEGRNAGEHVIGPIEVTCTPPAGVVLREERIVEKEACNGDGPLIQSVEPDEGPTSGGTTVRITYLGPVNIEGNATVETVLFGSRDAPSFSGGNGSVTAVTPPGEGEVPVELVLKCQGTRNPGHFTYRNVEKAEYKNWAFGGSITDKRLGQAITLPEGATFNGSGEVNVESGAGSVKGSLTVPPFTAVLKLFGGLPVKLGMTIAQAGPLEGTVAKSETVSGDEMLSIPLKLNLGVSSLSLLGLKIPATCASAEPLALGLVDNLTSRELLDTGWSFTGVTSVPKLKCQGGLLGALFGPILSAFLSGPENPYSLSIKAPSG